MVCGLAGSEKSLKSGALCFSLGDSLHLWVMPEHRPFTILSGRGNLAVRPVGEKAFEANNRDCLSQSSLIEAVEPT
jgi:hypothetical protein